jgi:hypothetical protein
MIHKRGTQLRHYATNQKFAGSIPDDTIGLSIDLILPAITMTLGATQFLTEISAMNFMGGKGKPTGE